MSKLSVNINKVATIRNARGGNLPNPMAFAQAAENFGAEGITIHPRPDQRHITTADVHALKKVVINEFNIEGYPSEEFVKLVKAIQPDQVTLVPDGPDVITSNAGWDCIQQAEFLRPIIEDLQSVGCRVSVFLDPEVEQVKAASELGTNRIELYTEAYADGYAVNKEKAIAPYVAAAKQANQLQLGLNAGHDLNLENLRYFKSEIPNLLEVSIGHALVSDALYYGLNNTIQMYLEKLKD